MRCKRTEAGKQKRREQQRLKYREKYEANRDQELIRRKQYYENNREYECDRHKAYYDQHAGKNTAEQRIAREPSRGIAVAGRLAKRGCIGINEYHRLISDRLALSDGLTTKD